MDTVHTPAVARDKYVDLHALGQFGLDSPDRSRLVDAARERSLQQFRN
ncbi:MAG TPA: hypothetical protein VNX60_10695 [Candidatus Acidoferrum sp.]|nr:hypothetical protein [Candidatus Acidoferrum sp.]